MGRVIHAHDKTAVEHFSLGWVLRNVKHGAEYFRMSRQDAAVNSESDGLLRLGILYVRGGDEDDVS